jgi:hypothetical protein
VLSELSSVDALQMHSLSSELLLMICDFLVDPRDLINLRTINERIRTALPEMIGTNLEYFMLYRSRFGIFRDRIYKGPYDRHWSPKLSQGLDVSALLFWDLSKENFFPHHSFSGKAGNIVEAVETTSRTCIHDNIDDEDILSCSIGV